MELERQKVSGTLPSLEEQKVESIMMKPRDLVVTNPDDFTFLSEADLDGILSLIQ